MQVSSTPNIEVETRTSRVKSPDTPQEVVAAGAALVELDGTEITVCVTSASLETGASLAGDVPPTVTVTVTSVGARRILSLMTIN